MGPEPARNQWTQKMFLQNIVGSLKAEGDGLLKQCGFGLLGLGAAIVERIRGK